MRPNIQTIYQAERGRSGVASARAFLEEALALGKQNHPFAHQIRERLRQLARRGTRPQLLAGLSLREAEVLRLVAQGLSNREIAEALVISERTVANHLANIFNKTRVDNRAGATPPRPGGVIAGVRSLLVNSSYHNASLPVPHRGSHSSNF